MAKKRETIVVSKRIPVEIIHSLGSLGIDVGHAIEQHLKELAGKSTCPTCGKPFNKKDKKKERPS